MRYQGEDIRRKVGKAGKYTMTYGVKIAKGDARKSRGHRRHIRVPSGSPVRRIAPASS